MQLYASYQEDASSSNRFATPRAGLDTATFRFAPDAVVPALVTIVVSRHELQSIPKCQAVPRPGRHAIADLSRSWKSAGSSVALTRGVEYSFDTPEAYYVEQSATLAYTHRLFGEVDAQVRGSRASIRLRRATRRCRHIPTRSILAAGEPRL